MCQEKKEEGDSLALKIAWMQELEDNIKKEQRMTIYKGM